MPARPQRMFPMLSVGDLGTSLAFYRDLLGGTEEYRFPPEEPVFVTLRLGESEIGIGALGDAPLHGQPYLSDPDGNLVMLTAEGAG